MPNIAAVLKQEIVRLARKEVKDQTEVARKATARQRRDIASLKRHVGELAEQVQYLERQERKRAADEPPEAAAGRRFSARGLKTHRRKLGLSAAGYAALLGVSAQTIYNWEQGRSKPRRQQLGALVSIRPLGKRDAEKRLELIQG